jgi:hypothetical protein
VGFHSNRVNKTNVDHYFYSTMTINKWTLGLLSGGVISLSSVTHAEEQVNHVLTALSSTTLSGYVDTSATWKFGTGNANMPGRVYDGSDTQDGFNLNVVSLTLEKPLDEGQWSAGYHVQMLMGPGAAKRGTGLVSPVTNGSGGTAPASSFSDFAFNEAYVALRVPVGNGIDFKVGQFGTFNGYEAYDTYKNPNWSRSYGFYIESSAHTGIAATYRINDMFTVMGGVGNTASFSNQVDARSGVESRKAYLAMVTFTAPESFGFAKGATLSAGYTSGTNDKTVSPPNGGPRVENIYAGLNIPTPLQGLSIGLAYDYTADIPTAVPQKHSYANAAALYLVYQATEKLKLNGRFDYASGSNGAYGYTSTSSDGRNELFSITVTADYAIWKNLISRAEFRWDTCLSSDRPFGGTTAGVGSDKNAVSLTGNLVYMF